MKCECYLQSEIDDYDMHALDCPCHPRNVRIAKKTEEEKKSAQPGVQPTGGILPDFLASLTPEQLSALKVLLTPPTSG